MLIATTVVAKWLGFWCVERRVAGSSLAPVLEIFREREKKKKGQGFWRGRGTVYDGTVRTKFPVLVPVC